MNLFTELVNFSDLGDIYHLAMIICGFGALFFAGLTCISTIKKNKSQSDFYKYKKLGGKHNEKRKYY